MQRLEFCRHLINMGLEPLSPDFPIYSNRRWLGKGDVTVCISRSHDLSATVFLSQSGPVLNLPPGDALLAVAKALRFDPVEHQESAPRAVRGTCSRLLELQDRKTKSLRDQFKAEDWGRRKGSGEKISKRARPGKGIGRAAVGKSAV